MSCGCKTEKNQVKQNESNELKTFTSSGMSAIHNSNFIVRLLYFFIAAPLVLLMLPIVYIILFNHLVLGNSTNIVNLFKKILFIDWYKNLKNKQKEKELLKEELEDIEEVENPEEFIYKDVYVSPVDKIDSEEIK